MLTRVLALGAALLLPLACLAEDKDKAGVKTIDLKGVKLKVENGKVDRPIVLRSADDLKRYVEDREQAEKLAREIDFSHHKALLFAWAGSGRDKLEPRQEKDKVTFTYSPGRTRDLRQHRYLFAIPKDSTFEVGL